MTWSRHLFLFYFFKRENKIKKKTLSMTPYLEKICLLKKSSLVRGSGYLLERYGKDRSAPLSPQKWVYTK